MVQKGKRVGPKRSRTFSPALLLLSLGVTLCVVAWGYLVKAAIDFGGQAREGESAGWWLLALASLGAVACLFVGLMLISRITRRLGITSPREPAAPAAESLESVGPAVGTIGPPLGTLETLDTDARPAVPRAPAPRVPGGRRAAR